LIIFVVFQTEIWMAGLSDDVRTVVATSGEPILQTMHPSPESSSDAYVMALSDGISAYKLWQLQKEKRDLRKEYLDYWESSFEMTGTGRPVDAIIAPVAPYAAPPHGMNKFVLSLMLQTSSADDAITQ
jgi:amidase